MTIRTNGLTSIRTALGELPILKRLGETVPKKEPSGLSGDAYIAHRLELIQKSEKRGFTSLEEREWTVTFDSLELNDDNSKSISRIMAWDPNGMRKGAILYGPVGTGKSTLCKALINRWASPQYRCKFVTVADALKTIKTAMDNTVDSTVSREVDLLIDPSLLIFDDLGVDNASAFAKEMIFSIFESRARSGRHTWFTTNLSSEEIQKTYGVRIHDRLLEFCSWVDVTGNSFRKLKFRNEI